MIRELVNKDVIISAAQLYSMVRDARGRTLNLVADLNEHQFTVPCIETVNPLAWELGHIAYFYEVFLLRLLDGTAPILEEVDQLYDSFLVGHDDRWSLQLPSREKTLKYMREVMGLVLVRLDAKEPTAEETYLYLLCVHHEDMHGEAFTHMRQTLEYQEPRVEIVNADSTLTELGGGALPGDVKIPGGQFQLGAHKTASFVFDNEKWAHSVEVAAFQMARAPVTNEDYLDFVEDGGYLREELWDPQGWIWRCRTGVEHPRYWRRGGQEWLRQNFGQLVPLQRNIPIVHVNWYEARAYCNWVGRRLPTETEWEMAAAAEPPEDRLRNGQTKRRYPWGNSPPTSDRANLDSHLRGCVEVGAFPAGDSAVGCRQMLGNIWEWTDSSFNPFPGFVADYPYREYSVPWFGDRKVLKGGAWATRSRLAYNTYRNFFQPHRNDIFAGFRTCSR